MKHNFSKAQLEHLRERMWRIGVEFEGSNDERHLDLNRIEYHSIIINFEHESMPKVDGTARYMAENYSSVSTMVPGLVCVDTIEEAHQFLDLVAAQEEPIDYEKVLKCVAAVHDQGWHDRIYSFVEDADELPTECDGAPYWYEKLPDGAHMTTTVNASNVYGSHHDIAQPKDEDALLIAILADVGGEAEIKLEWPLKAFEVNDLEEFLVKQLLCVNESYAYVRVDLMGAIWLNSVAENAEFLEEVVNSEDFKRFYHDQKMAIDEWTMTAGLPEYQSEEWYEKLEELSY